MLDADCVNRHVQGLLSGWPDIRLIVGYWALDVAALR